MQSTGKRTGPQRSPSKYQKTLLSQSEGAQQVAKEVLEVQREALKSTREFQTQLLHILLRIATSQEGGDGFKPS